MIFIMGILLCASFYGLVRWIEVCDKRILVERRQLPIACFVISCVLVPLAHQRAGMELLFESILIVYLVTTAWIDYKTMQVYGILNGITALCGLLYGGIHIYREGWNLSVLLGYILYGILVMVQKKCKVYGAGDGDVYLVCALYLVWEAKEGMPILYLLIHSFVATVVFILGNVKHMDGKRLCMKREIAFVPSILVATLLILVLYR